jgi:hypothetical protein
MTMERRTAHITNRNRRTGETWRVIERYATNVARLMRRMRGGNVR